MPGAMDTTLSFDRPDVASGSGAATRSQSTRVADDKAMLRAAADLTRDLNAPRPLIYWADLMLSVVIGYGALIARAEDWLREQGMHRALGPISMSIWEEPGLLIEGFDHPPTVMMGHAKPEYRGWIEGAGYTSVKQLFTYELDITKEFPPIVRRIIQSGERNERIRIREVDKSKFEEEAAIILAILNDAWSDNWGFVPLTPPEIKDVGVKLKPIVFNDLIRIAEVEGKPVAFMITLPDLNEAIAPLRPRR